MFYANFEIFSHVAQKIPTCVKILSFSEISRTFRWEKKSSSVPGFYSNGKGVFGIIRNGAIDNMKNGQIFMIRPNFPGHSFFFLLFGYCLHRSRNPEGVSTEGGIFLCRGCYQPKFAPLSQTKPLMQAKFLSKYKCQSESQCASNSAAKCEIELAFSPRWNSSSWFFVILQVVNFRGQCFSKI